jgi:hypothetical protein
MLFMSQSQNLPTLKADAASSSNVPLVDANIQVDVTSIQKTRRPQVTSSNTLSLVGVTKPGMPRMNVKMQRRRVRL